jgi:D-alanine transaminase
MEVSPMTTNKVFLNGEFIEQQHAKISVLDRGFLFGDSIYEVIPFFNGEMLHGDWHLDRLASSMAGISLKSPYTKEKWLSLLVQLGQTCLEKEFCIYLQVSRGAMKTRAYPIPSDYSPTVFMTTIPSTQATYPQGLSVVAVPDQRWQTCYIKANTLLPNVMAKYAAHQSHADDVIYIRNDFALEGSSSNLFVVKNGQITTPPLTGNILPGITRRITLALMQKHQLPFVERDITHNELLQADEIWLSSSTLDIAPVTQLDEKKVGTGEIGPAWKNINTLYQTYKQKYCHRPEARDV